MSNKISKTVDNAIREGWAKLATKQFTVAMASIGSITDTGYGTGSEVERRMERVTQYLHTAGAAATKSYFNTYHAK